MASAEPSEHFDFRPYLAPGERLLWTGKPDPEPKVRPEALPIGIALIFVFGAVIVTVLIRAEGGDRWVWLAVATVFFAIGLQLVFIAPKEDRRARRGISYAVTDRRVLRADRGQTAIRARNLGEIETVELIRNRGKGTVRFRIAGDADHPEREEVHLLPTESPFPLFLDIADAEEVAHLVNRLRREVRAQQARIAALWGQDRETG